MSTLDVIADQVSETLADPSILSSTILDVINRGRQFISGRVLLDTLEAAEVITSEVDTFEVSIPSGWNFMRNLSSASVEGANKIQVVGSLEHLRRHYPTFDTDKHSGQIEFVTLHAGNIVYYPIPVEPVDISVWYHKQVDLSLISPDELPEDYQDQILSSYALWQLFTIIEDSLEKGKPNTLWHMKIFFETLAELEDRVSTGQSRPLPDRLNTWE